MAFIVKDGEGVEKEVKSPLSRAPLDRAIDCLKLAQMGNRECQRQWNTFAEESPGSARVVATYVRKDNEKIAAATKQADKMLRRGEMATTGFIGKAHTAGGKPWKPKKPKKVTKGAGQPGMSKAAQGQQAVVEAWFASDLDRTSPNFDPSRFNAAWSIVYGSRE